MTRFDPSWTFFSIDVEVSAVCDLDCAMCPRDRITRPQDVMAASTFMTLAEQAAVLSSRLTLCGMGNPLLNPLWPEFVRTYHNYGGQIGLLVHAAGLTGKNCGQLVDSSPDFLEISFPSCTAAVFDRLCPGCSYDQCLRQVLNLADSRTRRFPLVMTSVETRLNPNEAADSKAFWKEHGLTSRTYRCHSRGQNLEAADLTVAVARPVETCGLFAIQAFINWEGKLLSCCHDLTNATVIGDVNEDRLEDLMQRKAEILAGGMPYDICGNCDDSRAGLPVPDQPYIAAGKSRSKFLRQWSRRSS